MKIIALIFLIFGMSASISNAQTPVTTLGDCMAQKTTGADREHLAKWVFTIMALHPALENLSSISDDERQATDLLTAMLVTRLITENCPREAVTTSRRGGKRAVMKAFNTMGQIAMQELLRNERVASGGEKFAKYIDWNKINSLSENE